jgi:hypothetical protein
LLQEKARRYSEKLAKGEIVVRRVIVREGEETPPQKGVSFIRRVIGLPPPIAADLVWRAKQVDPEAVAKREVELEPDQPEPKPISGLISCPP